MSTIQQQPEFVDAPPTLASVCRALAEVAASDAHALAEGVHYFTTDLSLDQQWLLVDNLATLGRDCRTLTQQLAKAADDADAAAKRRVTRP
jgi:hypothetical protein